MNEILIITASVFIGTFAAQWATVGVAKWLDRRSSRRHESGMSEMYQRLDKARSQRAGEAN